MIDFISTFNPDLLKMEEFIILFLGIAVFLISIG
jgi:hypothetical protein